MEPRPERNGGVADGGGTRARVARSSLLVLLLPWLAGPGAAQEPTRWFGSAGLALTVPSGELADQMDTGVGLGGQLLYRLDPAGALALRVDGAGVTYGSERGRAPLSPTVPRIEVEVTTRNNILVLGAGPQLTLPAGAFRPYLNAAAGLGYFYTESAVRGSRDHRRREFARTTNFSDTQLSYGVGGGLQLGLRPGRKPLHLELDVQYRRHGETRYLTEGDIREDETGRITIQPRSSDADLWVLRLGLSFGL